MPDPDPTDPAASAVGGGRPLHLVGDDGQPLSVVLQIGMQVHGAETRAEAERAADQIVQWLRAGLEQGAADYAAEHGLAFDVLGDVPPASA